MSQESQQKAVHVWVSSIQLDRHRKSS